MKKPVIIVDDSLTVRMDLDARFCEAGFETVLCAHAASARAAVQSHAAGLIVLDVVLPDADGVDLLAEFRAAPNTRDTPIIMLSSHAELADRLRGLKSGADEYVGKPYDADHLMSRAHELLQAAQDAASSTVPLVLVVDDSASVRQKLTDVLEVEGYRVAVAEDGQKGLAAAERLRPDAIVVDSVMPGMEGTTFIQRVRLDPTLRKTPCLLLTASRKRSYELEALDAGADAYLHKSDGADVFLVRLAALLRSREVEPILRDASKRRITQTVLAVDDSLTYREKLRRELSSDGYDVITAASGDEALDLLAERDVDCILLDLMMPGMDGTELCQRIKRSSEWRHIPLIMLTAREEREAMIAGINAGADDYVTKSANFNLLQARLRAQLRREHYEKENRLIRDELLRMELEARAARDVAEAKEELLHKVEEQNRQLADANQALARAKRRAEEESRFKSKFLASMSHELRTPLNAIIGFSELMLREIPGPLQPKQRDYVENVSSSGKHLLDLINDVLDLSKIEAGRMELKRKKTSIEALFDTLSGICQPLANKKGIELSFDVAAGMPLVNADPTRLKQIMYNLLSNAIKFTPADGQVDVSASEQSGTMTLRITDTGVGISKADQSRLFREFEQLEPGQNVTNEEGTGLGLALVKRLVDMHDGSIEVDSALGAGSTFRIHLPVNSADENNDSHPTSAEKS